MSKYGPCLVQLKRYDEAEEPLLRAFERLQASGKPEKPVRQVLTALIELYDNTGRPAEAAKWRAELAALKPTSGPSSAPAPPAPTAAATQSAH
jgi:hypothetical protein